MGKMLATQAEFEELTLVDMESLDVKSIDKLADGLSQCHALK